MDLRMPLVAAVLVLVFGTAAIAEDDKPIEAFFGEYEGTTVVDEGNALSKRELHVEISEAKKGFRLSWKTVIHKPDGRKKTSENAFEFRPSGREGIFVSAVRKDMFGNRVPLDPLKGESLSLGEDRPRHAERLRDGHQRRGRHRTADLRPHADRVRPRTEVFAVHRRLVEKSHHRPPGPGRQLIKRRRMAGWLVC